MSAYSGIYTDLNGLAQLRASAERRPDAALEEMAGQFEALFTKMMLKTMRESSLGDKLFDSSQSDQYLEMFDSQVAVEMSRGRGLGLKEMLIRQLGGDPGNPQTSGIRAPITLPPRRSALSVVNEMQSSADTAPGPVNWKPASKDEFVSELMPFARQIEAELGISHRAVLAHAALESGWGRYTMQRADGNDAFNLFGIKADRSWDGPRVGVKTLEFRDGVAVRERASFRAYDSLQQSMNDYASFLKDNPRYQQALEHGADPHRFVRELQRAGYATDPAYADKLIGLIDSTTLNEAVELTTAQLY